MLPQKLNFTASNEQAMKYLNVLLKKTDAHDIETIDFGEPILLNHIVGFLQEQLDILSSIAEKCPRLQYLHRSCIFEL